MSILDDPVARWSALELQAEVQRLEARVATEEARAAAMKRLYLAALARVEQVHRGLDVLQRRCRWLLWRCREDAARGSMSERWYFARISHSDRYRRIRARTVAGYVVHREVDLYAPPGDTWTVSHPHNGCSIVTDCPTRSHAEEAARTLRDRLPWVLRLRGGPEVITEEQDAEALAVIAEIKASWRDR